MSVEKNQKRVNFTKKERSDLMNILQKYPVIESKQINKNSRAEKNKAWSTVTKEFNQVEGHLIARSEKQLKKLKENILNDHKRSLRNQKKEVFNTEGGIITSTFTENSHLELLGINDVEMHNAKDGDRFMMLNPPNSLLCENIEIARLEEKAMRNKKDDTVANNHSDNEQLEGLKEQCEDFEQDCEEFENINIPNFDRRTESTSCRVRRESDAMSEKLLMERRRLIGLEHRLKRDILNEDHAWKKEEHELRIKILLLERELLLEKIEATKAKKLYYKAINNQKKPIPRQRRLSPLHEESLMIRVTKSSATEELYSTANNHVFFLTHIGQPSRLYRKSRVEPRRTISTP